MIMKLNKIASIIFMKRAIPGNILPPLLMVIGLICFKGSANSQQQGQMFKWPEGKQVAISLTFDDARESQVLIGTGLLNQYKIKATFYLVPSSTVKQLAGWKKAVAEGHEIGNHSLLHPCTGNFPWARKKALEDYTLKKMERELITTNDSIRILLGVQPKSFAYPCGQTFVGRGINTRSYVPVVAKLFGSGRGWLDEGPNDPAFCDFAQLTGMEMDGKDFDEIVPLITAAKETGKWLVLAGHEIGESGRQTTRVAMLKRLFEYAEDPSHGIWIAPVATVTEYIKKARR
jgi:peptidoglycan/xylan/chitin deacetylase (PgdA/CDA1 family)